VNVVRRTFAPVLLIAVGCLGTSGPRCAGRRRGARLPHGLLRLPAAAERGRLPAGGRAVDPPGGHRDPARVGAVGRSARRHLGRDGGAFAQPVARPGLQEPRARRRVHDRRHGPAALHPGLHEIVYVPKAGHDDIEPTEGERIDAMEFVARVLVQIPDTRRHLVRYYGAYSNATRGKRKKAAASAEPSSADEAPEDAAIPQGPHRAALRRRWAELIRRVYSTAAGPSRSRSVSPSKDSMLPRTRTAPLPGAEFAGQRRERRVDRLSVPAPVGSHLAGKVQRHLGRRHSGEAREQQRGQRQRRRVPRRHRPEPGAGPSHVSRHARAKGDRWTSAASRGFSHHSPSLLASRMQVSPSSGTLRYSAE